MPTFYDCHMHCSGIQKGGFLIALESKKYNHVYDNQEVMEKAVGGIIPVQYVTKEFGATKTHIIKYHPRLEGYTPSMVTEDIKKRKPSAVIIDTLNEPNWKSEDYWNISRIYPNVQFLFAHSGGYAIYDFLKICDFQPNVWLDFSYTQHYFGWAGEKEPNPLVASAIDYSLREKRLYRRILFGSDTPFTDQEEAVIKYEKYNSCKQILNDNFLKFIEEAGI